MPRLGPGFVLAPGVFEELEEAGSTGGRRSFSMSDLRLHEYRSQNVVGRSFFKKNKGVAHASSKVLMAFLMPSAPRASVPYGSLDEPEMLLSSDTRSDSSLSIQRKGIFPPSP